MMTVLDGATCKSQYYPGKVHVNEFCAETKALKKSVCFVSRFFSKLLWKSLEISLQINIS